MEKMLFIRIPKNASTSIYFDDKINIYRNHTIKKHGTYQDIINNTKFDNKPIIFCICRNPYDRFISLYFYIQKSISKGLNFDDDKWVLPIEKMSFLSFCKYIKKIGVETDEITNPQNFFVCDKNKNLVADYVIRFENLKNDWYNFSKIMNFKFFSDIKLDNNTSHLNYEFYYNKQSKSIVYELYKKDFEIFKYNK